MNIATQQDIDQQITTALKKAETQNQGFQLLMDTYQERLYWHIRRMVTSHEDANDVIQNCFIKVFRGFHNFKGDAKLYTWLYRIATNECLTFLSKKKKHRSEELDKNSLSKSLQADPYFDGTTIQLLLQEAISTLPEKQRSVFNMRYFDNFSYQDIAEITGTTVGGLKASYHLAVKKVESFVKKHSA